MECLMTSLLLIGGFVRRNAAYTLGFSGSTELFLLGLALRRGLFGEVVVRREGVRRGHSRVLGGPLRGAFLLPLVMHFAKPILSRPTSSPLVARPWATLPGCVPPWRT